MHLIPIQDLFTKNMHVIQKKEGREGGGADQNPKEVRNFFSVWAFYIVQKAGEGWEKNRNGLPLETT